MSTAASVTQPTERRLRDTSRLPYIDGLRAIAVALVLWFHAQLPGLPNGYLGVDIFFVISGFLIPAQITDQVSAGSFSIRDFYARRVVRILPPLLVVVLTVLVLTCVLPILPFDMRRIAWSAVASLGISANWYFLQGSDYFAASSESEPLLHLWSLAVEEQFYLIVPAVMLGLAFLSRRTSQNLYRLGLMSAVATIVLSLGATMAFARSKPIEVFYLTPLRAWEFATGTAAVLAMRCGLTLPRSFARLGVIAGLIAIGITSAFAVSDPSARLVLQVVSVVGATAVLLCGAFARGGFGQSILCCRPMVGVGLISYALYLWHWPLLSFWRLTHVERPTVVQNVGVGIVVPLLLAVLTYVCVERPLRRWRQARLPAEKRSRIILQGVAASALLAIVAGADVGWATYLSGMERYRPYQDAGRHPLENCPMGARGDAPLPACSLGGKPPSRVLIWGDSHALSASVAVGDIATELQRRADLQWDGGCPPLPGNTLYLAAAVWTSCVQRNDVVMRWLTSPSNDLAKTTGVVLAADWSQRLGHASPETSRVQALANLTEAMSITLGKLRHVGLRILVIGPVPILKYPAVSCLFLTPMEESWRCRLPRGEFEQKNADVVAALRTASSRFENVRFIDPGEAFCDAEACWPGRDGELYYGDTSHLTWIGARVLKDHFKQHFLWVFSAPQRDKLPQK